MENRPVMPSKSDNGPEIFVAHHASVTWNSPLPPAGELQKLKEVVPNAPERILAMAEKEQQARISAREKEIAIDADAVDSERRLIEVNAANIRFCSLLAFLAVCLVLAVVVFGFVKGEGLGGGILGIGGLCAIVWAFRRETRMSRNEVSSDRQAKK